MTSPAPSLDLDAYLLRIGYAGARAPTLEVLRTITERHALSITFEALDVLLGLPIRLDLPSIEDKIVARRRGGYCFEQNTLLAAALRRIGFAVETLGARVRWKVAPGARTPRTHMLLCVTLDGERWLVDGGFGGVGLTAPLRMDDDGEQPSLFEAQRLVPIRPGRKLLQVRLNGEWRDLYVFDDEPEDPIDFEVANWFTSSHPESRFKKNLIVTAAAPGVRCALLNRELSIYRSGSVERLAVDDPEHLLAVLATHFRLVFPAGTRFGDPGAPWAR